MSNLPIPYYYNQFTAKECSYLTYMGDLTMTINNQIENNGNKQIAANAQFASEIQKTLNNNQSATENAMYNNTQQVNNTLMTGFLGVSNQLQSGFSQVSRQLGVMTANMSMAFAALNSVVQESSEAICDRLDTMNDILNNPSLTKSRELFRRASVNYNKGFYDEVIEDLLNAIKSNKTDYISWFLLGKTYLFGVGEFSTVIDLDASIEALKNAVKYITPDARIHGEAKTMAAEICFFLGLAQHNKAMDIFHDQNIADCQKYLEQAAVSYGNSWGYSSKMLEALYNRARCWAFLNNVRYAFSDLKEVILQDHNYFSKITLDSDFDNIKNELLELFNQLRKEYYSKAKSYFDRINKIWSEFPDPYSSEIMKIITNMPSMALTEDTPLIDILEGIVRFPEILLLLEKMR